MPRVLNETKHFQAAAQIRALVNALTPGDQLPVARELMEHLNMSHGTVMQALKRLADEGMIVRPFGKQRYVIAERFECVTARICMIRPDYPSADLDTIVQRVYEVGKQRNWKFDQYCFRNWSELDFEKISAGMDAIVLLPTAEVLSPEFIQALLKPQRPVIVLLQHLPAGTLLNVCIDDFEVGKMAAEALIAKGHRQILFIKDQPLETTMSERLNGFRAGAALLGVSHDDGLLLDTHLHSFDDAQSASYRMLSELLDKGKPDFTAVFSASLAGGISALRALREHGLKVPEEIAVLAFGGESKLAPFLYPPLSSIEIDAQLFGTYTAELLEVAFSGVPAATPQRLLEPKLILRETL